MSKKPDHIILMVADSLRYDSVHSQENLLPYITNNGTTFTEARSAGCWTLPATSSLFTGKMPHEHGATAQTRAIRKDIPTLAEKMKEGGYRTYQVTANVVTTDIFGLNRGFDEIRRIWKMVDPKFNNLQKLLVLLGKPRLRKKILSKDFLLQKMSEDLDMAKTWLQYTFLDIFDEVKEIIKTSNEKGEKAFIFVNLMETHFPYHIAPTFQPDSNGILNKLEEVVSLYHMVNQTFLKTGKEHIKPKMLEVLKGRQAKAWKTIGPHIDQLAKEIHQSQNNLFIFGADHGENFGETGWTYHFSNVTDAGNKVPLFMLDNSESTKKTIAKPISSKDVFHTLVQKIGLNSDGPNLLNEVETSSPVLQSFWYNNKGETLDKYRYNQICFIENDKRYLLRNNDWFISNLKTDYDEPDFVLFDGNGDPILDAGIDVKRKEEIEKTLIDFRKFSAGIKLQ